MRIPHATTTMVPRAAAAMVKLGPRVLRPRLARAIAATTSTPSPSDPISTDNDGKTASTRPAANSSAATPRSTLPSRKTRQQLMETPVQNWRELMDAVDVMIEEAEKKVVKKYRPNTFAEFKQLNDTDGKVLVGGMSLITAAHAQKVPPLAVQTLDGQAEDLKQVLCRSDAKVTLLLTSFKQYGLGMLAGWHEPFQKAFNATQASVVMLHVIEDWYVQLFRAAMRRGLRNDTPARLHPSAYAHFGRCDDFRTALDLYNTFVGYAHLIDNKGRVRWIAGGPATPDETRRLLRLTNELLASQQTKKKQQR